MARRRRRIKRRRRAAAPLEQVLALALEIQALELVQRKPDGEEEREDNAEGKTHDICVNPSPLDAGMDQHKDCKMKWREHWDQCVQNQLTKSLLVMRAMTPATSKLECGTVSD
jgi:hypothetical protein